jgi:anti-sigma-K factor RskA
VAAALAGVVAGLAIEDASQQNQISTAQQHAGAAAAQASALAALLAAPDVHSAVGQVSTGGAAVVVDSRSRDEAAITLAGLTEPGAGQAYQLWMIGPGGTRSGGVVALDAHGSSGTILARGLGDAKTVGLTVEPAGGSAKPTTTPVLLLNMSS